MFDQNGRNSQNIEGLHVLILECHVTVALFRRDQVKLRWISARSIDVQRLVQGTQGLVCSLSFSISEVDFSEKKFKNRLRSLHVHYRQGAKPLFQPKPKPSSPHQPPPPHPTSLQPHLSKPHTTTTHNRNHGPSPSPSPLLLPLTY